MSGLPKGWVETTLGDLGRWQGGGTPDKSNASYWAAGNIPWVSPKDMKRFLISEAEDLITEAALAASSTNLIPEGSTLIVTRSGILKHTLPVALTGAPVAINQDIKALTPSSELDSVFVARQIEALGPFVLRNCTKAGTTVDSVDFDRLKRVNVPLPPLAEQKRIVAKLDALNAKSTRARTELARIETLVARYKQAVLGKAFVNSKGRLLNLAEVIEPDAPIRYGVLQPGSIKDVGVPLIRVCDLVDSRVAWEQLRRIERSIDHQFANARIRNGDVLLSVVGTIGRIALVEGMNEPANIARAIVRIRPNQSIVKPEWLALRLQASDCQEGFSGDAREVARKTLNVSIIRETELVLPSLEEQHGIVRRIESAFARIDRLATEAKRALDLLGKLDEAILAKAFRGELVPQDEDDEPAEQLLARIRAERGAAPKRKRGQRKISTPVKTTHRRGAAEMNKGRRDVGQNYLAILLKEIGGRTSASDLWLQSGMNIDEFYKQLRTEIDLGQISEGADKGELVSTDAN